MWNDWTEKTWLTKIVLVVMLKLPWQSLSLKGLKEMEMKDMKKGGDE